MSASRRFYECLLVETQIEFLPGFVFNEMHIASAMRVAPRGLFDCAGVTLTWGGNRPRLYSSAALRLKRQTPERRVTISHR